jgi:hypothetical protein
VVTRLKTVQYCMPALASITNNTVTAFTTTTLYLPENSKTFRKVVATFTADDIITATGGSFTTKTREFRLGAVAFSSVANANTKTNSGENDTIRLTTDMTSHFQTNWTGTSMTFDFQVTINQSTGTTLGLVNGCLTIDITYEYDDTTTTHVKTVWIPLNMPVGALATTKPASLDTIPALDTYLPEASKTYRQLFIVMQGNESNAAGTTDFTLQAQIDSLTQLTSGNHEAALASDRWSRYVWDITGLGMTTNATHTWHAWSSTARFNHMQAWMVVTYEFDASTTTSVMNSLLLPMEILSPMGGTTSSDYQRASRELFVQEPNVTLNKLAFYMFWEQAAAVGGLNIRVGTGSFVAYTDVAAQLCGGNGCMIRNDAPTGLSFARGRNTLQLDVYRTDTADLGWNISGFWIVNYTSDIHADGVGAHNHTIIWNLANTSTSAAAVQVQVAATAPIIPESDYYLTAVGTQYLHDTNATGLGGVSILVERLSAEGGVQWEEAYVDVNQTDVENGMRQFYSQVKDLFLRWPGDLGSDRMNLETNRRWRVISAPNMAAFHHLDLMFTYHTITFAVAGNVTGFTGTVNLGLHRSATGEKVKSTTRSGDGAYSFTWYDNTEDMFVSANDGTKWGQSMDQTAV